MFALFINAYSVAFQFRQRKKTSLSCICVRIHSDSGLPSFYRELRSEAAWGQIVGDNWFIHGNENVKGTINVELRSTGDTHGKSGD